MKKSHGHPGNQSSDRTITVSNLFFIGSVKLDEERLAATGGKSRRST